jgi:competence protein ComFC
MKSLKFNSDLSKLFRYFEDTFENVLNLATDTECVVCGSQSFGKRLCKDCALLINGPPAITTQKVGPHEVHYFGFYEDKLREFILAYKFKNHHSLAKSFGEMLYKTVVVNNIPIEIITYVPATKSAKKKRGYDHMRLIAIELSKKLRIPMVDALKAVRETDQLLTKDRAEAVKGKFALRKEAKLLEGKKILLIDDVLTTGNTMLEAVRILKSTKPDNISCCVIALNKG